MALSYYGIQQALAALMPVDPNVGHNSQTHFRYVFIEGMDRDFLLHNMPACNIRLTEVQREVRSLPNSYYAYLSFEVDVIAYDLTHFREAAIVRDALLGVAEDAVKNNPHFHVDIETASVVPSVRFAVFSPEGAGGHIAMATFVVKAEAYIEASNP